jgi:hypothetical protein
MPSCQLLFTVDSGMNSEERVILGGNVWVFLESQPRPIAESFKRMLEPEGIPCYMKTPYGWVMGSNVIEVEVGIYQGDVMLYVPEVCFEAARHILGEPED